MIGVGIIKLLTKTRNLSSEAIRLVGDKNVNINYDILDIVGKEESEG